MSSYYQNLLDPRWIKKRKKILKRDSFKCTVCGSVNKLRVHHTYYTGQNTPPWAYPNNSLLTLCNDCHEKYHKEHELTFQVHHNKSDKIRKPKKPKKIKEKIFKPPSLAKLQNKEPKYKKRIPDKGLL
jgi:5-methylcytosine-specific restriction endonuclease McrA